MNEKIVILDYSTVSVDIRDIPRHISRNVKKTEDWLTEKGYKLGNCNWMIGEDLSINFG